MVPPKHQRTMIVLYNYLIDLAVHIDDTKDKLLSLIGETNLDYYCYCPLQYSSSWFLHHHLVAIGLLPTKPYNVYETNAHTFVSE